MVKITQQSSLFAPITKLLRSVKERGWEGTMIQLYLIGDIKFGTLMGTDKFGNKYYENLDLPFGQHRWIEYANIHNYDASMIQPEWHGWMHHVFDETPDQMNSEVFETLQTTSVTNAIYGNHVGKINPRDDKEQVDTTQYRQRGYKVGSLMTGPEDPDHYYKQPGHPLSPLADKGGRLPTNDEGVWSPDSEDAKK